MERVFVGMYTFDIKITASHASVALRRFLFRKLGRGGLFAVVLLVAYLAYSLTYDDFDFGTSTISALLLLLLGIITCAYLVRRKQFNQQLARLKGQPITYTLSSAEWSIESNISTASYKWEMIVELWVYSDVVLLFFNHEAYVTLPTNQVPREALDFLIDKVHQLGMPVRDYRTNTNHV